MIKRIRSVSLQFWALLLIMTASAIGFSATYGKSGGGGQDPSNVAITGGSIAGTTINGFSSSTLITSENYLEDFEGWKRSMYSQASAIDPTLTYCWANPAGSSEGTATTTTTLSSQADDANGEGGVVTSVAGTYRYTKYSIAQNTPGGHIAFFLYTKMATPTTGVIALAGLLNGSGTHAISFVSRNSISATNVVAQILGGGTTTVTLAVADGAWHSQLYSDDGTTIRFLRDGVVAGSTTTRTNLTQEPMYIYWFNDAKGHVNVRWYGYCTAQPPS